MKKWKRQFFFYTDRDKENFHTILYHMIMDASYEKEVKELLYQQAKAYMPVPTSEGGLEVLLKEDFADVTWDGPRKKVSESKTTIDYLENSVELDVYVRDNGSMVICLAIGGSGNSERKKTEPEWTNFDNIMRYILDNLDDIELFVGTHNESSTYLAMDLMNEKNISRKDDRVWFGQLYGMSDHISFNLGAEGYNVGKYIPFGPVKDVMPYLIRRAEENTSVAGQTSRELTLLKKEKARRKL